MTRQLKTLAVAPLALVAGLILLQPRAFADTLQLTGLKTNFTMGGVYTSPYLVSVNGGTPSIMFACDDFTKDISIGHTWTANEVDLSEIGDGGPQKFKTAVAVSIPGGTTTTYTIAQEYNAAAYLAEQLLTVPSILADSDLAGEYSFAIWQIFYSGAINGWNGNHHLTSTQQAAVGALMTTAFSYTGSLAGMYLYTPDPDTSSQEFIGFSSAKVPTTSVPEAATPAFLAFNFLALSGVMFLRRRRSL